MAECKPRERKKLFKMKNEWVDEMKLAYLKSSSSSKHMRTRAH